MQNLHLNAELYCVSYFLIGPFDTFSNNLCAKEQKMYCNNKYEKKEKSFANGEGFNRLYVLYVISL